MKAIVLFYHSVYDDAIRSMLGELGCIRYVEVPQAWASDNGEQRFGTHVYPGTDSLILAFVDDGCVDEIAASVEVFRQGKAREHTHVAVLAVERFV